MLWRGDVHMHTLCSDGGSTYEEMVQKALELQFDFMAITDHRDWGAWTPARLKAYQRCIDEMIAQCKAETRLLCIPGMEQAYAGLHFVFLGVQSRTDSWPPSLVGQVEEIHRQGGLAIAAHPYSPVSEGDPIYTDDELLNSGFDAMECARGTEEQNQHQWQLADQYNIPCVYVSDAHNQTDLGHRYTVCTVPINSLADLHAALVGKKCKMN